MSNNMALGNTNNSVINKRFEWEIEEYTRHERTKQWYAIAISVALFLMLFSFLTGNFLFAVIIVITALVVILHDGSAPARVRVLLTSEGVSVGRKFYDYDEINDFTVIYKPQHGVKNIYFEFKSVLRHRLSVPLLMQDPLQIREFLLQYLEEDLDRTDQPLSEALAKIFKL